MNAPPFYQKLSKQKQHQIYLLILLLMVKEQHYNQHYQPILSNLPICFFIYHVQANKGHPSFQQYIIHYLSIKPLRYDQTLIRNHNGSYCQGHQNVLWLGNLLNEYIFYRFKLICSKVSQTICAQYFVQRIQDLHLTNILEFLIQKQECVD